MSLHLLRNVPPFIDGEPASLEKWYRLIRIWRKDGYYFGSWTRRAPKRVDELKGGSVYFVHRGETVCRLPFHGLEPITKENFPRATEQWIGHVAIVCWPEIIKVAPMRVRYLRGWRYLEQDKAPRDLDASVPADLADAGDRAFDRIMAGGQA